MNGVRARDQSCADDIWDVQIALTTWSRSNTNMLIGQAHGKGVSISFGMGDDTANTHFATGANYPQCDLTTVGDQYLTKHKQPFPARFPPDHAGGDGVELRRMPIPGQGTPSGNGVALAVVRRLLYLLKSGYRKGCPLNSLKCQSQRVGDDCLYPPNHGHFHATVEPGPASHKRFSRANCKVRKKADNGRGNDGRDALQEEERNNRDKCAKAGRKHSGERRYPGIGEAFLREPQFFLGHSAQELFWFLCQAGREQFRLFLGKPLQLVEER